MPTYTIEQKKNNIPYFQAPNLANLEGIQHGFFTRQGGVSLPPFDTLNFARNKLASLEEIAKNKELVTTVFDLTTDKLIMLDQQHTCDVLVSPSNGAIGDALVTNDPQKAIAVITADCVPILFADPVAKVISATHGGWRGLLNGILENTIQKMVNLGATKENIYAAIGPCIHQANFEIGPEVFKDFTKKSPENEAFFTQPHTGDGHRYMDLPSFTHKNLDALGVSNVCDTQLDTYTNPDMFFSYRRSCHQKITGNGCQISLVFST